MSDEHFKHGADAAPEIPTGLFDEIGPDPRDQEIQALHDEVSGLKDRLLRLAADMENMRKRGERERAEATLYAATNFARDMLSVGDNLSRALMAIPQENRAQLDEATRNLLGGVEVTERELLNVFHRHNIRRVIPFGVKFDPNMHQAMFEVPTADHQPGTVVQVLQPGYSIGERCMRPALVGVAKAPPPPEEKPPEPEAGTQLLDI